MGSSLKSHALGYLGGVALRRGNYDEAERYDSEALAEALKANDSALIASALHGLSTSAYLQEDYQASTKHAGKALRRYRDIGDKRGEAGVLNMLAILAGVRGQGEEQTNLALAAFREIGDLARGAVVLNNLGSAAYLNGDYVSAIRYTSEALQILEELDQYYSIAHTLVSQGLAYAAMGNLNFARVFHCRALIIAHEIHSGQVTLFALIGMADLHATMGDFLPGAKLLGLVLNHPAVTPDIRLDAETAERRLRENLSQDAFEGALAEGAKQNLESIVNRYLAECAGQS